MALKKKHEEHENHERWLVSYADFITLLFAFFVVMYSISSVNEGKYRVVSEALKEAFSRDKHQRKGNPGPGGITISRDNKPSERKDGWKQLGGVMNPLRVLDSGTVVTIGGKHPFDEGEFTLKAEHLGILDEIKLGMVGKQNVIEIRGHTSGDPDDSLVIENGLIREYKSTDARSSADHWLLSYLRAKAVADYLTQGPEPRIDAVQIKLLALAYTEPEILEHHPENEENAKENRRVDVRITSKTVK